MASNSDAVATNASETAECRRATRSFARRTRMVLVVAGVLVVSTVGGASAAALITGSQIKNGTVTGRDVHDHSLRPKDAQSGVVRPGPRGPQGLQGHQGADGVVAGPRGRDGLGGFVTQVSPDALPVSHGEVLTSTIPCPSGLTALNGGVSGQDATAVGAMVLAASVPSMSGGTPTGWTVAVRNTSTTTDIGVFLWATCGAIR
jgi:hypothetical protein